VNSCQPGLAQRRRDQEPLLLGSAPGILQLLVSAAFVVGAVEGRAGAVEGRRDEVAVDLVGDLDAVVAEPAGDLRDRDSFSQSSEGA
jgi:hypothetical protein